MTRRMAAQLVPAHPRPGAACRLKLCTGHNCRPYARAGFDLPGPMRRRRQAAAMCSMCWPSREFGSFEILAC